MSIKFEADLRRLLSTLVESSKETITDDMDLIEEGVIDSLNIINLLTFIEEQTGADISIETLDLDHIRNVKAIVAHYAEQEHTP